MEIVNLLLLRNSSFSFNMNINLFILLIIQTTCSIINSTHILSIPFLIL